MELIYFSYLEGVVAFIVLCAVALLPAYNISYTYREAIRVNRARTPIYSGR